PDGEEIEVDADGNPVDSSGGGSGGPDSNSPSSGSGGGDFVSEGEGIIVDQSTVVPAGCGDGTPTEDEACDDGNTVGDDGCNADCLGVMPGYSCAQPGELCQPIARCGDGLVAPSEQCDDGNTDYGDGCSDRCKVELGKKCEGEPSV